jgi:serine/threonine-protein kinase
MNASAPTSSTRLAPGQWLDRYELLAQIAEGGFGAVWLARLQGTRGFEKLVAIKVPRQTADVSVQEMLLDEARIASAIDHENVVRIVELGEQRETLYIVMEWIDGEPLSSLLRTLDRKRSAFPLAIALRIVAETCAGAHAAHELRGPDGTELGVVHRDISPQNVIVTCTGRVKLIDFGIVKAKDRAIGETTDGTLKGKIKYMAPEQAFGRTIDRRTDVFALGAVLFRLLAGRAPYEADNEVATLHALNTGAATPLPDDVPPLVRDVILRALERSPDARFATALEMQQALEAATASLGLQTDPSSVTAFLDEHLQEHIATRHSAVEAALKAAAERSAIQKLVGMSAPNARRSDSGSGSAPSHSAARPASPPASSQPIVPADAVMDLSAGATSFSQAPTRLRSRWPVAVASFTMALLGTSLIVHAVRDRLPSSPEPMPTSTSVAAPTPAPPQPAQIEIVEVPVPSPTEAASGHAPSAAATSAAASASARPHVVPRSATPKAKPQPKSATPDGTADFGY